MIREALENLNEANKGYSEYMKMHDELGALDERLAKKLDDHRDSTRLQVIAVSKRPMKVAESKWAEWITETKYKNKHIAGYFYGGSNSSPRDKFLKKAKPDFYIMKVANGQIWIFEDGEEGKEWDGKL